jgi:hypothetical protein
MKIECEREQDVLDALAAQRWPARCDDELRTHVEQCRLCTDLAAVASALLDEQDTACCDVDLPPSGLVWWRAQLRAREEDARAAARPIAFVQGVAASVAVWLIVTLVRSVPTATLVVWKEWLAGFVPHVTEPLPGITALTAGLPFAVLLVAGAALLLAPLVIYFAVNED